MLSACSEINSHLSIFDDHTRGKLLEHTAKEISTFVSTLPRLEYIHDSSLYLSTTPTTFPEMMEYLGVTVPGGTSEVSPLLISKIDHLHILPFCGSVRERKENLEGQVWDRKIHALIEKVEQIDLLTLTMPGLPTCCSHGSRLPDDHAFKSPLEDLSYTLECLLLSLQTCHPSPGSSRESQWVCNTYRGSDESSTDISRSHHRSGGTSVGFRHLVSK